MKLHLLLRRAATAGVIGVTSLVATVAVYPMPATFASTSPCLLLWDAAPDAPDPIAAAGGQQQQDDTADIEGLAISDDGSQLKVVFTVKSQGTTMANDLPPGYLSENYFARWTYAGNHYVAEVDVAPSNFGYQGYGGKVGSPLFSPLTVSGTTGADARIEIDVPLADVGNPPGGSTLADVTAVSHLNGYSVSADVDSDRGSSYTVGGACPPPPVVATPTPTPSATPLPSPSATATPTPTPTPSPSIRPSPSPSATASPSASPTPSASASPAPGAGSGGITPGHRSGELTYLGPLALPAKFPSGASANFLAPTATRAYLFYQAAGTNEYRLAEYDLTAPGVPPLLRDAGTGLVSGAGLAIYGTPYTSAIDPVHHRAWLLVDEFQGSGLISIDLDTLSFSPVVDLAPSLAGIRLSGITYSAADARLYGIGDISGDVFGAEYVGPPQHAAAVSIDPGTDAVIWRDVVPGCAKVMDVFITGALIARGSRTPASLFFICSPGALVQVTGAPGPAAIMRLEIDPAGTQASVVGFKSTAYPISGQYYQSGLAGLAAYDPVADRVALNSLSFSTPGIWVLDASTSSWAGFVGTPEDCTNHFGLDSSTGRLYAGCHTPYRSSAAKHGYTVVSDGRSSPPTQGEIDDMPMDGVPTIDAAHHRLFYSTTFTSPDGTSHSFVSVTQDSVPATNAQPAVNYDQFTTDAAETAATRTNYSGDTRGFGVRVADVGGTGSAFHNVPGCDIQDCSPQGQLSGTSGTGGGALPVDTVGTLVPPLRPGDRGVYAARVGGVDLRNVSASAGAQGLQIDNFTNDDLQAYTSQVGQAPPSEPVMSCNDAGGAKSAPQASDGLASASATCDQAGGQAAATASAALAAAGVAVASSSFTTTVTRDPAKGLVTVSRATADGLTMSSPGGSVSIGHVQTDTVTSAHGRPGTASATWTRTLEQVKVTDANGNLVYGCTSSQTCDPSAAVAAMNQVLTGHLLVTLPAAAIASTPRGAFAEVRKSDVDFNNDATVYNDRSHEVAALQAVVFDDSSQRERAVFQFAGVQASSIYEIQLPAGVAPPPANSVPLPGAVTVPINAVSTALGTVITAIAVAADLPAPAPSAPALSTRIREGATRVAEGLLLVLRSPADALRFAGVWSLFGSAGWLLWRRRALAGVL